MVEILTSNSATDASVYSSLGGYLQSFSDITQIDALFYGLSGVLVHNNDVYKDERLIQNQLDIRSIVNYTIFPITVNAKIWGFILCNSDKVSKQRITLSKEYIANILEQVFDEASENAVTSVLDPLSSEEFSQINYLSILLKMSPRVAVNENSEIEADESALCDQIESYGSLKKATEYVLNNINRPFSLNDVANKVYLSPSYLSRLFKKYLNVTFIDYVNHLKIAKAKEKLALTSRPINVISTDVGFSQTSYFTKTFKKIADTTPSSFRRKNSSTTKIFTIPHTLDWNDKSTVFDVSKKYFNDHGIDFFYQNTNGFLYVNSIDNLTDSNENSGWLFSVDGKHPAALSDNIGVSEASEVQWIYTDLTSI